VAALLAAVLLVGGAVLWGTTRDGGSGGAGAQDAPASSPAGEDGAGAPATTGPEGNGTPADGDAAAVVEETLGQYYGHLPDDPSSAYAMTGPTLRDAADRAYYEDFWSPWAEVELEDVRDAEAGDDGVVTATTEVRFTRPDGSEEVEVHEVRLVPADDGGWLVDLDRYVDTVG
jgi:hypothetical protein